MFVCLFVCLFGMLFVLLACLCLCFSLCADAMFASNVTAERKANAATADAT